MIGGKLATYWWRYASIDMISNVSYCCSRTSLMFIFFTHLNTCSCIYRSSLRFLFVTEGVKGLFKGYSLNIIKGPVTLSLSLTTYDLLLGLMREWERWQQSAGLRDHTQISVRGREYVWTCTCTNLRFYKVLIILNYVFIYMCVNKKLS